MLGPRKRASRSKTRTKKLVFLLFFTPQTHSQNTTPFLQNLQNSPQNDQNLATKPPTPSKTLTPAPTPSERIFFLKTPNQKILSADVILAKNIPPRQTDKY